ncbi:DNA polymerase Y family protein [Actinoplanes sp. NEAU-A12]|uniref:DNA polymerase Y family protein n=1 Tax=Actinoplanes sandaracinus TaxID=3045177 RepID=A0ABT6WDX7_9ACTN|nr:DNA polymerase Y family protein [Actinoplanes sandaracinus]MDI6097932.1 DNA polymerase Y family protein [Actinoplanes sandaracinus]
MGGVVEAAVRTLLVWCPDWPVAAAEIVAGVDSAAPVAVFSGNRVLACSEAARQEGVRRGLRRRDAQGRCPHLVVVEHDAGRDARAFEPVVAAIEEVVAGVEVLRPGVCAAAVRGPARYFGGEEAAAERIVEQVALACAVECQIGIADGVFAAGIAARTGRIVEAGKSREFLSSVPVEALEEPELTDLLKRLGVVTLGDFAALPAGDVLTRFGFEGALAHRLASGGDSRPLALRKPPPDLAVEETYDETLDRVDVAAFAGRVLAERLHERLAGHGLACTRLGIEAVTADGQELLRVWRHDGMLTAAAIAERVRWQLDGWLTGARRGRVERPTAGLVRLRLVPDGVLAHVGLQPGLWGETGAGRERAHRAFSRVQGLLGPGAVVTPVLGGGRSVDDQVRLVPWGDEREPERPAAVHVDPIPGIEVVPVLNRAVSPPLRLVTVDQGEDPGEPGDGPGTGSRRGLVLVNGGSPERWGEPGAGDQARDPAEPETGDFTMVEVRPGRRRRPGGKAARPPALPPWPGRLPKPSPAVVLAHPLPAAVQDAAGRPVGVSARLELTGLPATLRIDRRPPVAITGWAGPWPVDERWWASGEARRRARFQMVLEDGRALLLSLTGGHWLIEAVYD